MRISRRATALAVAALAGGWVLAAPGTASAAPTLTIDQTCGPAKASVTVKGTGVVGVRSVYIYAQRPNGDYVGQAIAAVDAAGNFATKTPLTFDVSTRGTDAPAPPAVLIAVYDRAGRNVASAWYTVGDYNPARCGIVGASPVYSMRQPAATAVTVTMYAFSPITPITVSVPGAPPARVPASIDGGAQVTVNTDGLACGVNTITATQESIDHKKPEPPIGFAPSVAAAAAPTETPPPRTAATRIVVFCPQITASPASFGDTALPGSSTVTGSGWYVRRVPVPVEVLLDSVKLGETNPDATGAISTRLRIPRASCGVHRLTARQSYDNHDGFSITLTAETPVTVRCAVADLAVDPPVTEAGRTVDAVGGSFIAGRTVTLEWTALDGSPMGEAATATVEPDGTFRVTILVMPNSDLGTRKLHALESPGAGDPVGAREGFAEVLIVPGSMTPGRGHFLERR